MDFVEAIRQYKGYESALRHIRSEQIQIDDLENRIDNAKGCMENAAQVIVARYLGHLIENKRLDDNLALCVKAIVHTYLHLMESDGQADSNVWDNTILRRIGILNEAKALQDGYSEMFADIVKDNAEVRAMIERRHCDLVKAQRDLLITVIQAAEAGHNSPTLVRAYNLVR